MIKVVFTSIVEAQTERSKGDLIMISGKVNCVNPLNGRLSLVSIYNISKDWGTISDVDGEFKLKMGRDDTIVFFTAEHKDYQYFLEDDKEFKDHSISVYMETDAIWLETVNIIGQSNLDEFKMDILKMEVAEINISIASPDLNKYAKELATGKPAPLLIGPLTYLREKFSKQYKMNNKMQKVIYE